LDDYEKYLLDMAKQRRERLAARNKALSPAQAVSLVATPASDAINSVALSARSMPSVGQNNSKNEPEKLFKSKEQRQQEAKERAALAEKAKPLKSRLRQLEDSIAALKAEQDALHNKLIHPLPSAELIEANKRLAKISSEIEDTEWKWLEISERIDGLLAS
jgi:ATP-binding cassette subfamily F protein 3